jgi:dUTP pyrophosphatase
LGYTATSKNIIYHDSNTHRIKTATHCTFDEAATTVPSNKQSHAQRALQHLGYSTKHNQALLEQDEHKQDDQVQQYNSKATLQVELLSLNAMLPSRATEHSAGYDVYSAIETAILPNSRSLVPLDISVIPPSGTYVQIMSRSGLATKHSIDVKAGTIDWDYRGNVHVLLHNSSETPYHIQIGDRVAQLIIYPIDTPAVIPAAVTVQTTECADKGFGSSGISAKVRTVITAKEDILQYNLCLSQDPFDDTLTVSIPIKGDHPTLGMLMEYCLHRGCHGYQYTRQPDP